MKWSKVISWTKNEELKVEVRDFVQEQKKLNLSLTVEYLQNKIENDFVNQNHNIINTNNSNNSNGY